MNIKRSERGWGAHYCCSNLCLFRRNTLLEYKDIKLIVSTVGNMYIEGKLETIGINRYYETMVFYSSNDKYNDIDVTKQFDDIKSNCWLNEQDDIKANEMHETVVNEIIENIRSD